MQVGELETRLRKQGVGLQMTKSAKDYLLRHGYDALNGVRPMRRLIQETLEDHIASQLLSDSYTRGDIVKVSARADKLAYTVISE